MSLDTLSLIKDSGLTWTTFGVSQNEDILTSQDTGVSAYDKVAYAPLSIASEYVYASVTFGNATGFQFAGISQTMTDTSSIEPPNSKIAFGFRQIGTIIVPVYNGNFGDIQTVLGSIGEDATYTVVRTPTDILYYKNYQIKLRKDSIPLNDTPYRLAYVAYSINSTTTLTCGECNPAPTLPTQPTLADPTVTAYPDSLTFVFPEGSSGGDPNAIYSVWVYIGETLQSSNSLTNTLSVPVTGLTPETEYSYTYQIENFAGTSGVSSPLFATTRPPYLPPSQVTGISMTKTSLNSITVTWTAEVVDPATQAPSTGIYNVYLLDDSGARILTSTAYDVTCIFSGLSLGTYAKAEVCVINSAQLEEPGVIYTVDPAIVISDPVGPNAPSGVTMTQQGMSIVVEWVDATFDPITQLSIRTYSASLYTSTGSVVTLESRSSSAVFTSLQGGTYLYAEVRTIDDAGVESSATQSTSPSITINMRSLTYTSKTITSTSSPSGEVISYSFTDLAIDGVLITQDVLCLSYLGIGADLIMLIGTTSTPGEYQGSVTIPTGVYADGDVFVCLTLNDSQAADQIDSNTISLGSIPTGGGGGGGGGGGNNEDNEHNNMSAALEYNYPSWEAPVTQTNTITVLGEDSAALAVDETITVNVPLAKFKECLVYDSSWALLTGEASGEQPLPKVAFRPSAEAAAKTELDAMFAKLKAKMADKPLAERTWDDDASASHDSFGKRLIQDVSFTNSVFDSQDLPKVAIRSIAEGDISVDELTTTVAPVTTEANASHKVYLEGLFEQLVAANRIKGDDAASSAAPAFGPAKCPSLQVGDSISFKVKYTFSKTREYEVDGLVGTDGGAPKALTLTIGGSTFTIQTGADGSESSDPYARTYEVKMVATA